MSISGYENSEAGEFGYRLHLFKGSGASAEHFLSYSVSSVEAISRPEDPIQVHTTAHPLSTVKGVDWGDLLGMMALSGGRLLGKRTIMLLVLAPQSLFLATQSAGLQPRTKRHVLPVGLGTGGGPMPGTANC